MVLRAAPTRAVDLHALVQFLDVVLDVAALAIHVLTCR